MFPKEYYVEMSMARGLQVSELRMLCQLVEWNFDEGEPSIEVFDQMLRISFLKSKLIEKKWSKSESDFFDGLKLLGIIKGWQAAESDDSEEDIEK
jgi:hypothetical protein